MGTPKFALDCKAIPIL